MAQDTGIVATTPTTAADVANAKNRNRSISEIANTLSSNASDVVTALTSIASAITASIIGGTTGGTANRLLTSKGTGGFALQASGASADSSGNINTNGGDLTVDDITADSISLTTALTVPNGGIGVASTTAYAVICGGTTSTAALQSIASVGTSGQLLTSNGPGALPTFQAAPTQTVTAVAAAAVSSASTLDISLTSTYDMYEIDIVAFRPASDNDTLLMRFSQSGSFLSGGTDYQYGVQANGVGSQSEGASAITLTSAIGNNTNEYVTLQVHIFRPTASSFQKTAIYAGQGRTGNPTSNAIQGGGGLILNTSAIDGVRFLFNAGNISQGYYAVRGYKYS